MGEVGVDGVSWCCGGPAVCPATKPRNTLPAHYMMLGTEMFFFHVQAKGNNQELME